MSEVQPVSQLLRGLEAVAQRSGWGLWICYSETGLPAPTCLKLSAGVRVGRSWSKGFFWRAHLSQKMMVKCIYILYYICNRFHLLLKLTQIHQGIECKTPRNSGQSWETSKEWHSHWVASDHEPRPHLNPAPPGRGSLPSTWRGIQAPSIKKRYPGIRLILVLGCNVSTGHLLQAKGI